MTDNMQDQTSQQDLNKVSLDWRLKRTYYDTRTFLSRYYLPYLPLKKWEYSRYKKKFGLDTEVEGIRWGVVRKNTDIVIEGFPRSGNTFASVAFRFAQKRQVRMAYRLHAPIQLIQATHLNIPAIALIRQPEDAVLSWVIHRPHITIHQALRGYIRFYESVLPFLEHLVVADFNTVVTDFNVIIQKVNSKWDSNFDAFIHTEENVTKCFNLIDDFYQKSGAGKIPEKIVARPSENRKQLKEILSHNFNKKTPASMREDASSLYQKFLSSSE
jgi:hypothetical protein